MQAVTVPAEEGTRVNRTHTIFPGSWLDKRKVREAEKEERGKRKEGGERGHIKQLPEVF